MGGPGGLPPNLAKKIEILIKIEYIFYISESVWGETSQGSYPHGASPYGGAPHDEAP